LNVIPILEQELSTDNTELRTLATRALGEMFSQPGNLASTYQTVWKIWLQRMNDKAAQVRVAWVEQAITFFLNNSSELKQVQEGLINKVQDTDDKVRAAACKIIGLIGYDLVKQLVDVKLIEVLSLRCKDKKVTDL
jgi:sister-chromatid-cohesion protein PDS5